MRLKILFALLVIALSGCAAKINSKVDFNPSEPIRIAVLPFARVDDGKIIEDEDENLAIDDVSIVSSALDDTPAGFIQSLVQSELSRAALDVITPAVIEAQLSHNGYDRPGTQPVKLNLTKIHAASPQTLCTKLLSCDAVLVGKVVKWDRTYLGLQSVSTVGIDVKMLSAKDGKVLFSAYGEDSDSRGLTKGPTGISDLIIEPVRGLDSKIITDLAREVVSKMMKPLAISNRPGFLNTAPPAIIAGAHDSRNGVISNNGKLTVIALGTPGQTGSFSIGDSVLNIPMVERESGHYIGEYFPVPGDSFSNQYAVVQLKDSFGREINQRLGRTALTLR